MRTELTELAGVHARWLSLRQEAVSANVANADRPGYRALKGPDFAAVLDASARGTTLDPARAILPSGNSVDLAQSMIEGGIIGREHGINAAVSSAFHRMTLMGIGQ